MTVNPDVMDVYTS